MCLGVEGGGTTSLCLGLSPTAVNEIRGEQGDVISSTKPTAEGKESNTYPAFTILTAVQRIQICDKGKLFFMEELQLN